MDPDRPRASTENARPAPPIVSVLETVLYAHDLRAAEAFFTRVLGFPLVSADRERSLAFRVAESAVLLVFDPRRSAEADRPVPSHGPRDLGTIGPGHAAFRIEPEQRDAWIAHLRACGVEIEQQVEWPLTRDPSTPTIGRSVYFRDPAGNSIELVTANIWRRVP